MTEELVVEKVAKRMEGLKQFTLNATEVCYYAKTIWARDYDHAREIADKAHDWGEAVDYADFDVYDIEEEL